MAQPPTSALEPTGPQRTAMISIITASSLMVLMLGVGLVSGSLGLVSAGIESTGDVAAAVVTFFAVRLGSRPADDSHPFGHRRVENLSALAEASILLAGGVIVVVQAARRLIGDSSPLTAKWYVFAVIGLAIVINISRAVVSRRRKRAVHHRLGRSKRIARPSAPARRQTRGGTSPGAPLDR